ncbi:MAG: hypothetical protein LDL44_18930 [Caenispirillum sp.]|nr:hypothetical protein [Caenispirillum sp.]
MALSEADTCRKFVVPQLQAAGWDDEPHSIAEQRSITDGRIVPVGKGFVRKPQQRPDQGMLANIPLPIPPLAGQRRIVAELDALQAEVDTLKRHQRSTTAELDALLPAIRDRAFRGEP